MSRVFIDNAIFTAIANAIRTKLETETTYYPKDMANAILSIEGSGVDSSVETEDPEATGTKVLVKDSTLTSIADAIRTKTETNITYFPKDMAKAILSILNQQDIQNVSLYAASLLQDNWKFNLMGITSSDTYASTAYAASSYDDTGWDAVSVPHDWSIYRDFNSSSTATYEGGYLDGGDGWYRKELPITEDMAGKKFFVHFDGIYQISKIYVNGTLVGENYFGYNPFTVDITDQVTVGSTNVLAVFARNQTPSSRWYSGSGIFRNVTFLVGEDVTFGMSNIVLTTPNLKSEIAAGGNVTLHVAANLTSTEAADVHYDIVIKDKNGNQFFTQKDSLSTSVGTNTISKDYSIPQPNLWGELQGNYYTVEFKLYTTGEQYCTPAIKYGFRYIEWDKDGFYLNGSRIFLKGMCMHHDLGLLGAEVNRSAIDRQIKILKEMGCNSIRLTHNPSSTEYLDACVEEGILLIEEFFDTWTSTKETYDFHNYFTDKMPEVIETTLARDINNPAIIMWSLGNEIVRTSSYTTTTGPQIVQSIIDEIHKYDTTRPTTMGDDTPTNSVSWAIMDCLDIIGVNYGDDSEYQSVRAQFPNKCIYGSETTSALSSRGKYARDETNLYCSSLDNDYVSWGDAAATALKRHMETFDYITGIYVWTGFDYIGEPTPFNKWPAKSSYFGCIDLAGFPKDSYYLYQSRWTNMPMIHMFPAWSGTTGSNRTMYVYSNCDHIELFLNGTSVGSKSQPDMSSTMYYYTYSITFAKGTLVANGYDSDNNLVAQDVLYTPQTSAASLKLKADKTQVATDGSLVFVECRVNDSNNVIMPSGANSVTVTCSGGTVIGMDSGNSADTTNMRTSTRNAFSGKVLAMIRPDQAASQLTITASSDGLLSDTIHVTVGETNIFATETQEFIDATNPTIYDYASASSSYTYETVDVSGASSSGSSFSIDTRTVALSEYTYYTEIDVSNNQSTALQDILSIGTAISSWAPSSGGFNVHIYYPDSTSIISPLVYVVTNNGNHGVYLPSDSSVTTYRIAVNSNGIYINGSLVFNADSNGDNVTVVNNYTSIRSTAFSNMSTSASVTIGSQEGSTRNYSTWNDVKIYDELLTGDQMAEITALDYEEGSGDSTDVTYNLNYTLPSEQTFSGSSTGTTLSDVKLLANTSQAWSLLISFQGNMSNIEDSSSVISCGSFSLNTASSRYNTSYGNITEQTTISTLNTDLHQLFITHAEDANAITIYDLTSGTIGTITATSVSASSSGLVLGKNWTGTIYTLQTWDSSISINEALAILPDPTSVTLKRTEVDVPFGTTVNVGLASATPELSLGKAVMTAMINTVGTYSSAVFENGLVKITAGTAAGTDIINLELIDGTVLATITANIVEAASYEDESLLYKLSEETTLTASSQSPIETHVALLDEDKSFTFYIDFTPGTNTAVADTYCVFHNMHEANPWPGLSYQIDGSNYAFHWFTSSYDHTSATSTTNYKIAITHELGTETLLIYIGGSLITTLSATPTYGLTETLSIGAYKDSTGNYGRYWNGTIHDARIYNKVLTADEIAAIE